VHAIQTGDCELMEFSHVGDDGPPIRATWPVHRGTGAAASAAVYFELEPGQRLGNHTDSAEEMLVVLDGEVEVTVGGERGRLAAGGIALVPALVIHDVRAVGERPARVVGAFGSSTIVSEFERGFAPAGLRIVGTPPPEVPVDAFSAAR